jgi:predicted dehydrogenase
VPLQVAVVGAGYWGPNLIRNFQSHPATELRYVYDLDAERARKAIGRYSTVRVASALEQVLEDPEVEAVTIATPAATHLELALAALNAGKHVLVEKPLALTVAEGQKIVDAAEERGLTLMCDHTYCYTPAVQKIRELTHAGTIGEVQYVDSVRINLGPIRSDADVFWDLGPHDLSVLDFVLPPGCDPLAVAAHGADPIGAGLPYVGYLTVPLRGGAIAHAHLNWLSPTKIRTTIIAGSKRTIVWDDLNLTQPVSVYDRGVDKIGDPVGEERRKVLIAYRIGDMHAPALPTVEALHNVVGEFAAAVAERRAPLTDGHAGLRVLRVLEAATESLAWGGTMVSLSEVRGDARKGGARVNG